MTGAPHAPWPLTGESVLALVLPGRVPGRPLPSGMAAMPGPWLLSAARYLSSPVGPYLEVVVARPARLGLHLGWCMVEHAVDQQAARVGCTLNWGFPTEQAPLVWTTDGRSRGIEWVERGLSVVGRPTRLPLPLMTRLTWLQRRSDGPVTVPGGGRGLARVGFVVVEAKADDPLAPLSGGHLGATVNGWHVRIDPARMAVRMRHLRATLPGAVPEAYYEPEGP